MDITTKTVTTNVHTTTVSADETLALATVAVKNKIGIIGASSKVSATATRNADGSIAVEVVVEQPQADPAIVQPLAAQPTVAPVAGLVIPSIPTA